MANWFINLFKHKKGNLTDVFEVSQLIIIAVIILFVSSLLLTKFAQTIDVANPTGTNYTDFIEGASTKTSRTTDWALFGFLLVAMIFSIIMARKVPTEPLYIGIVLALSFVFFIVSFALSNFFGRLMDNVDIASFVTTNMPISLFIMQKLPFVVAVYVGIVIIVFFSKNDIA